MPADPKPTIKATGVAVFLYINGDWRPVRWQDKERDVPAFVQAITDLHGSVVLGEPVVIAVRERSKLQPDGDYGDDEAQVEEAQKTV